MDLEVLPNELLIECFKYLNAIDIFYSFDHLNSRFSTLIRQIFLHVDFRQIDKCQFDLFSIIIRYNREIKQQIRSLQLSNENFCQIYLFLSQFSLDEFSHLRSLTLIEVKEHNLVQLQYMLPLLSQLSSFYLIHSDKRSDQILSYLPRFQLRTLTIPRSSWLYNIASIIKLTIFECDTNTLHRILTIGVSLRYLSIDHVGRNSEYILFEKTDFSSLRQMIIKDFDDQCLEFIKILKKTPFLQSLTIFIDSDHDVLDADQWQNFIAWSLLCLRRFQFVFEYNYTNTNNDIHGKLRRFQTDFWQKQHRWFTEYILFGDVAVVYTLPLILDRYGLTSNMKIFSNKSIECKHKYEHVRDLIIDPDLKVDQIQDYFSYVTSLTLEKLSTTRNQTDIQSLTKVINFTHVNNLQIDSGYQMDTPCVLLDIFKQAPKISSISIDIQQLLPLLDVDEFCHYLKMMIRKLDLTSKLSILFENIYLMNKFCETFANVEQMTCRIQERDSLLFLLKHFPQLLRLNIASTTPRFIHQILDFEDEKMKLGIEIILDIHLTSMHGLSMWIIHYNSYLNSLEKLKTFKRDSIINRLQMKVNRIFKCV